MRWRLSGKNWEGRSWEVSDGIASIAGQISELVPAGHSADGTVASKNHDAANPKSDHRPTPYTGSGIVRAIDVGGPEATLIAEELRMSRDPRINYVIHKGRKFSSKSSSKAPAWSWYAYTGPNPHDSHFHLSVNASADTNGALWQIGGSMAWKSKDGYTYTDDAEWPPHEAGIKWSIDAGLMVGSRDAKTMTAVFMADRPIARGEAATVFKRFAGDADLLDEIAD